MKLLVEDFRVYDLVYLDFEFGEGGVDDDKWEECREVVVWEIKRGIWIGS